ncbi:MAG: 2Fe-2S iron-sulfur cluster-binding protein [Thermoguttaceae bacterium]
MNNSFVSIFIDGKEYQAAQSETILDVAARNGIGIPSLCAFSACSLSKSDTSDSPQQSRTPRTSCLVCLVKVSGRFVPACATSVEPGMNVESETSEVHTLRKSAMELLLSNHFGDCFAPCQLACPAGLAIPKMLREINAEKWDAAIRTIKETIPFPAVLGRVCPKPCEKICRRSGIDHPISICELKRRAADLDLASPNPFMPTVAPKTGKKVLLIGAGPSGLAAAYYLAKKGHHVSLYTQRKELGGRLRHWNESELPQSVLESEIAQILKMPIEVHREERIEWTEPHQLEQIRSQFDAILLCVGPCTPEILHRSGFTMVQNRLQVDSKTFLTSFPNVFATGTIFRAKSTMIVRSIADGREAAESIHNFLSCGVPFVQHYSSPIRHRGIRLGKLSESELQEMIKLTASTNNNTSTNKKESSSECHAGSHESVCESARCLHCDCRGREKCRLFKYAALYQAELNRFGDMERAPVKLISDGDVVFEPGKCIRCGLCIETTAQHAEPIGLTFKGRGFNVCVAVPFDEPLESGLTSSRHEAVRRCPTAALSRIEL